MIHWNNFTLRCGLTALLLASFGCQGDDAAAPLIPDPAKVFRNVEMNHEVVMLRPNSEYDTLQLRAVGISLTGDTLPVDHPVYFVKKVPNDATVQVDTVTGMVTALASTGTSSSTVYARMVVGRDTFVDSVQIMVRTDATLRRVTRIEISPLINPTTGLPTDSTWRWAGTTITPTFTNWIRVYDDAPTPAVIPATQRLASISIQNPAVAGAANNVNDAEYPGTIARALIGESYIYVRLYAYGQEFKDSILFRRIDPPVRLVMIDRVIPRNGAATIALYPGVVEAKVGTTVVFLNMFGGSDRSIGDGVSIIPCSGGGSTYCGNRIRYSQILPSYVASELVWVDSVDINFDQPDLVSAGVSFTAATSFPFKSAALPSDGGTGNIPAFSVVYCKGLAIPNNGCGTTQIAIGVAGSTRGIDTGIRSRRFMTAGTYTYSSTRFPGVTGTIIITE